MERSEQGRLYTRRAALKSAVGVAGTVSFAGCVFNPKPDHLEGLQGSTLPPESRSDYFERTFKQIVGDYTSTFDMEIPKTLYYYYKNRLRTSDYGGYVSERHDDEYISKIADEMIDYGERKELNESDTVYQAMGIIQNLKYTPEKPGKGFEYPKFPIETLYDKGGDCEDTSILAASILEKMGYDVILLGLPEIRHMAVGISKESLPIEGAYYPYKGKEYLYLETTSGGWRPGQAPQLVKDFVAKYGGFEGRIYEVGDQPVLAHQWKTVLLENGDIETRFGVVNVGDNVAKTAKVGVEFISEDGVVARSGPSAIENIDPETVYQTSLETDVPGDKKMKIRTSIFLQDEKVDEDVSPAVSPV